MGGHAGGLDRFFYQARREGTGRLHRLAQCWRGWNDVDKLNVFNADSLVSEAMIWQPIVLMAGEILKTPALKAKYGAKAESYLKMSEEMFEKYDKRGSCARPRTAAA